MRQTAISSFLAIAAIAVLPQFSPMQVELEAQRAGGGQKRVRTFQLQPSAESEVTLHEAQIIADGNGRFRLDITGPLTKDKTERFFWTVNRKTGEYTTLRLSDDDEKDAKRIEHAMRHHANLPLRGHQIVERLRAGRLRTERRSEEIRQRPVRLPGQVASTGSTSCSPAIDVAEIVHGPAVDEDADAEPQLWSVCSGSGFSDFQVWELARVLHVPVDYLSETYVGSFWTHDVQMFEPYAHFFTHQPGHLCWSKPLTAFGTHWYTIWCSGPQYTPFFSGFDLSNTGKYLNIDFPIVVLGWPLPIETWVTTTAAIQYNYNQFIYGNSFEIDASSSWLETLEEVLLLWGVDSGTGGEYDCHYNCEPGPFTIADCEASGNPEAPASYWDWGSCTCIVGASPIIVDLDEDDLNLTSVGEGVSFDILASGAPTQVAWTRAGTRDAFLVLDRNGNGLIDDAQELFGNYTDQPSIPASPSRRGGRNGFRALEVFDQPGAGGNRDQQITDEDAVYDRLGLWIDANHDGVSQPSELTTLQDEGVRSISLRYVLGKGTDSDGNVMRYRSHVTMERNGVPRGPMRRLAVDVILRAVLN